MHYYENPQLREKKLTRDFVNIHRETLYQILGLSHGDKVVVELQKARYGASGDVDIAVWKNPSSEDESLIGIEVKSLFLCEDGSGFKSEKLLKHNKQIKALEKEGWDYVYFFDFIVTAPANSWFHPQAFEGHDSYRKTVESEYGHVVFQINAVAGKPESMAGSISHNVIQEAKALETKEDRLKIVEAFKGFDFSFSSVIIDSV